MFLKDKIFVFVEENISFEHLNSIPRILIPYRTKSQFEVPATRALCKMLFQLISTASASSP